MSLVVVACMSTDVCPAAMREVTSTTSRSMPAMVPAVPARRGRSPALLTAAPRYERLPLKKFVAGFCASLSWFAAASGALPKRSESPVKALSPS